LKIREAFRMLVRAGIAVAAIVYSGLYTWRITFAQADAVNDEYAKIILGFLLGTLVTTIINFYLGGTDNEKIESPTTINNGPDSGTMYPFSGVSARGNEARLGDDATRKSSVDDGSV